MPDYSLLILGGLIVLFLSLIIEIVKNQTEEDMFIETLNWQGEEINLGDTIIIKTEEGYLEGNFRGIIAGSKQWIFRFSCEGKPGIELSWHEVLEIRKKL